MAIRPTAPAAPANDAAKEGYVPSRLSTAALASPTDVQIFSATTGQTAYWTKPPGARTVTVVAVGAGSGGGSGARRASGTATSGGAGGGGGGIATATFRANDLAAICSVNVGQGGAGGAAVTTDDTNGNAGTGQGTAQISQFLTGSSSLVRTHASIAGGGGGTAAGVAGGQGQGAVQGTAGAASTVGAAPATGAATGSAGTGGGAGGGISATPAAFAGSAGGTNTQLASIANGGAIGAAGSAGLSGSIAPVPGCGGGGGGSSITGAGGAGGAGGRYGGGGAGGGSSLNGQPSGAGGAGGDGVVVVTTYCDPVGADSWAAYGDSLTAGSGGNGTSYPGVITSLTGLSIANFGVGGEVSQQAAARAGVRTIDIPAVTIPTTGVVSVTPNPSVPSAQGAPVSGTLAGIRGTLEWNAGAPRFRRHEAGVAKATGGAPFIPDMARWADASGLLIWVGRNNLAETANVLADVAGIAARTRSGRYVVLSVLNGTAEPSGSGTYNTLKTLNDQLAAAHGAHYLDIRRYLIDHGLADAVITPTAQDLTDIANDVAPTSLRSDALHLNAAGYTVVGQQVAAKMTALGYT